MQLLEFEHEIILKNKNRIEITGIDKLEKLTKEEFCVKLKNKDYLTVIGNNLDMLNLNVEKGSIIINGEIYKLYYDQEEKNRKKKTFLEKLFK